MKLSAESIKNTAAWADVGARLPQYDVTTVGENTRSAPAWIHFGAGNIFRGFIAALSQSLLDQGLTDRGIIAADTFDYDIIDRIYAPYDNLTLLVSLLPDGSTEKTVIASVAEGIKVDFADPDAAARLREIFCSPSLQMVSFTITEKGYALKGLQGEYFPYVTQDLEHGPAAPTHAMSVIAALLYARYQAGKYPISLVSMDNCSHNGEKLQDSVLTVAQEWAERGLVEKDYLAWLTDERQVAFPWTMIDKITPRPAEAITKMLTDAGIEDMAPIVTSRSTFIAPFVNAEVPQYLVVEDKFPNGRPPLEKAGVYFTDRDTVNNVERMKVTTCLNPLHTALAVYGCLLGYTSIAAEMNDVQLHRLVERIGYDEGMPVVVDPGILSPRAFIDEVVQCRLPNPFIPDAPQRIACDTSQKVGIRFGETIKSYAAAGRANELTYIPLALAGWCRYLLGLDDELQPMELNPDPMLPTLCPMLGDVVIGGDFDAHAVLSPILSNPVIFGSDLYKVGLGEKIEAMFRDLTAGAGAVRRTLVKYLGE
ncbi:MAG: mannitol dehydrogenase family protein [Ruminococcaceae bacterium]|nr:mannitol dehydrogenase family protein [Oscillospiraceae bacterium]